MTFQKSFLKSAKTDKKKKSRLSQIKITNPLKKDIYVNAINLVCDIYFSLYGRCEISINGNAEFTPEDNAFKLRKEISIPLQDQILQRGKSIDVSIWNPVLGNTDIVELSAQIIISENIGNLVLSGQALDDSTILQGVSGGAGDELDTHDIFPYKIYRNEVKYFPINTKGRANMLLTMASSGILPPEIIENDFAITLIPTLDFQCTVNPNNIPDVTSATTTSTETSNRSGTSVIDYTLTTTQRYTITKYESLFDSLLYGDGSTFDMPIISPWVDEYVIIDGKNNSAKQIRLNFMNSVFSYLNYVRFAVLKESYVNYSRSKTDRLWYSIYGGSGARSLGSYSSWTSYTSASYQYPYVTQNFQIKILVDACDDVTFASDIEVLSTITTNGLKTYNTTKRYIRFRREITPTAPIPYSSSSDRGYGLLQTIPYYNPSSPISLTNMIDLLSHGGTAKLHFELKGVNDQWFIILDSSQLNSITQGDSKLIQYGIAGIPPSQSRFRAVLEVIGSLQTGVTLDLVA